MRLSRRGLLAAGGVAADERGGHDEAYWTRELPGQLDWLAERVSAG